MAPLLLLLPADLAHLSYLAYLPYGYNNYPMILLLKLTTRTGLPGLIAILNFK